MASTIVLRRRISSIKGTRQITRAMHLVSASKLRRAQSYAAASRDYRQLAYELLSKLSTLKEVERQPLFQKRPVKNRLYLIITSNTGLAGAYNSNVLKCFVDNLREDEAAKVKSSAITVGSKGANFARRLSHVDLLATYPPFGDQPTVNEARPILNTVIEQYQDKHVDEVKIIYTEFISTISQKAQALDLLPAKVLETEGEKSLMTNFEPDVETVIAQVATRLIEAQIWQALLESMASEQAMRMIATKNATDNANELIDDYTLELNTVRQAAITQELAEISGGVEALNS